MVGMETSPASSLDVIGEVSVAAAMEEQSHLTQVVVGVPPEEREEGTGEEEEEGGGGGLHRVSLVTEEEPAEVLRQVSYTIIEGIFISCLKDISLFRTSYYSGHYTNQDISIFRTSYYSGHFTLIRTSH